MEITGERLTEYFEQYSSGRVRNLPKPEWWIEDVVIQGGLVFVTGIQSQGKSHLVLSWLAHLNAGVSWFSHGTAISSVAYLCLEGNERSTFARLEANARRFGFQLDETPGRLLWLPSFSDKDEVQVSYLLAAVASGIQFIVLDTLARIAGSRNLKEQAEVSFLANLFEKLKAVNPRVTLVVVAHSTKDDKPGAAGSIQLDAMADGIWHMTKRGELFTATCTKNKYGADGHQLRFALEEDGDSVVFVEATAKNTIQKQKDHQRDLALLSAFERTDGEWIAMPRLIETLAPQFGISERATREVVEGAVKRGFLSERKNGKTKQLRVEVEVEAQNHFTSNINANQVDVEVVSPLGEHTATTDDTAESETF